jgi:hypothetical protein
MLAKLFLYFERNPLAICKFMCLLEMLTREGLLLKPKQSTVTIKSYLFIQNRSTGIFSYLGLLGLHKCNLFMQLQGIASILRSVNECCGQTLHLIAITSLSAALFMRWPAPYGVSIT